MSTYRVFKRSARNFDEFAKARKRVVRRNLTLAEARELCQSFNDSRSPIQVRAGHQVRV